MNGRDSERDKMPPDDQVTMGLTSVEHDAYLRNPHQLEESSMQETPLLNTRATTIEGICELLSASNAEAAAKKLQAEWPFRPFSRAKAALGEKQRMRVFIRDGFIDRYSGNRLVFPGTLRLIHKLMHEFELKEANEAGEQHSSDAVFPFQKNWDMRKTHIAFWELLPTVDHLVPLARGGHHVVENWMTTSQLRNSIKSHWLLDDLDWIRHDPGAMANWDGLTAWFLEETERHPEYLVGEPYLQRWHRAAAAFPLCNDGALAR